MEVLSFTGSLIKKATNLLGLNSPESPSAPPLDGEIIYCKNNVCVHPPAALSSDAQHFPGYLNIRSQEDEVLGTTLIMTWIPNNRLKKNPRSIENSPAHPRASPHRRSPRPEFAKSDWSPVTSPDSGASSPSSEHAERQKSGKPDKSDIPSTSSDDVSLGWVNISGADSGIASGSVSGDVGNANNTKPSKGHAKKASLGQHVNDLHCKESNIKTEHSNDSQPQNSSPANGTSSASSESSTSQSTQHKLADLVSTSRTHSSQDSRSSQRSVASVEMEGDKLVVVTEEMDDSPFVEESEAAKGDSRSKGHMSSDSSCQSSDTGQRYQTMIDELQEHTRAKLGENIEKNLYENSDKDKVDMLKQSLDLKLKVVNNTSSHQNAASCPSNTNESHHSSQSTENNQSEATNSQQPEVNGAVLSPAHSSSTATSGPDTTPPSPMTPPAYYPGSPGGRSDRASSEASSGTGGVTITHNMSFPENSVTYTSGRREKNDTYTQSAAEQVCGVFSVDIGQMRSLRIFYSDETHTSGQLVIASRESQYKILHFHHGGLDHLAQTFSEWKFLTTAKNKKKRHPQCEQYSVIRPYKPNKHKHPEEGAYEPVNEETWHKHMNKAGQIVDDFHLRKVIFFAGLEPSLRHEMWPFLLHYYPYTSTYEEREHLRNDRFIQYQDIRKQREAMSEEEKEQFWRNVQCTVEKDVVRTDRSQPYFKGDNNPNIEILKNILLNYAVAQPKYGYTQGMSDLLAPVLAEVQNEVDAYWCFVGLMQNTIFVSSPKDLDMDKQLNYLRELIRLQLPRFYKHLDRTQDGMELLFVHRWILLCFKREFPETEALTMWEACWAHYQTDYFHLFICLAIISVYGEDVVQEKLAADDMLLHFSSLAMHMNGHMVLKKARALMHTFRTRARIPCTLAGLCTLCSSGMWDSGHVPTVVCRGNHLDGVDECPYGGRVSLSE